MIRKEKIVKEILVDNCKKCGKVIKGTSESQMKYNMRLHMETHKKSQS